MTYMKGTFEMYKCDFCKDNEMFACEGNWESLDDGRDRCVTCLIKQRDELLERVRVLQLEEK